MRRFGSAPWWWSLTAVWLIVAGVALWLSVSESYHHLALLDLQVYRMGGRALLDGSPLYDARYPWDSLPFTYTPFAAIIFVPLALLSPGAAALVMTALSLMCLARAVVLVERHLPRRSGAAIPTTVIGAAIGLSLWATRSTLEFGQINLVILWLVLEDLFGVGRRSRWMGALLGVAIGIKLTPAFFLLFLLSIKQVRRVLVAGADAAATLAAG
jgi:alpha-1,2-mannosyltransferase